MRQATANQGAIGFREVPPGHDLLEVLQVKAHHLAVAVVVIAEDADARALDGGAAADGLPIVFRFELEKLAAVDDARDDFAAVDRLAVVDGDDVEFPVVVVRVGRQEHAEPVADRQPGGDDQEAAGEPFAAPRD